MKRYSLSALALLGLLTLSTGCDKDLLDQVDPNQPNKELFWKTESDAVRAMTAVYSGQQIFSTYSLYWHFATTGRTDESFTRTPDPGLNQYLVFRQASTTDGRSAFFWNDMYRMIFRCNQVLTNVPGINMNEALKKRILAEALFMRSLAYYDLALLFGNIPLVTSLADANTRVPQVTQAEAYAQVIADLAIAKADLPLTYDAANKGRATRGAAAALMGKAYLQQQKWAEASAQFAEVISSNQYSLVPNYVDNFTEGNENNSESIYEVQFSGANQVFGQDFPGASEGNERAQFFGPPGIGFTDVEIRPWVFAEFTDRTTAGGVDPRRDATMFSAAGTGGYYGRPFADASRIFWRKYQNDRTKGTENFFSGINIRLIRYADVLLMQAEALNEQNQPAAAAALVNQVRARVGLTPIATSGFTRETMRTQLRHERITELSGEGMRWSDLARYGLFDSAAGLAELRARDADFNNFVAPRNKLLPIPQTDIDIDRNLRQNPGY
ncbi:RagB/SusD family nutrient uptake outer membrane protein [Hymenobacter sp. UYP22]|uniref:RagB/SusD family nutrient uptake outer membrane protein n=1 Tax=Hymenobacter sp. UYP22 TaxID=3156348 RepID=UPI00339B94DF